jgi:Ca2+-binding RTX toxin-like protein
MYDFSFNRVKSAANFAVYYDQDKLLEDKIAAEKQIVEDTVSEILSIIISRGTTTVNSLAAIAINYATDKTIGLLFSGLWWLEESSIDSWFDLGDREILKFYDSNGNYDSGFYFPDGIDGLGSTRLAQEEGAVRAFISEAEGVGRTDLSMGGEIKIEQVISGVIWDTTLTSTYVIYNSSFLPQLLNMINSTVNEFLTAGDKTNLDAHAFGNFGNHYFFFKQGKELLKIPITINGIKEIHDVNNIYADTADSTPLLGTGAGVSKLIMAYNGGHLKGGLFDNILLGDDSNNTFEGAGVNDIFIGNGGNDTFFIKNGSGIIIDGGSGTDLIDSTSTNENVSIDLSAYYSVENVTTDNGNDNITGNSADNIIKSGGGNDVLTGGGGVDTLEGGAGFDTYNASAENVIIDSDGQGAVIFEGSTFKWRHS